MKIECVILSIFTIFSFSCSKSAQSDAGNSSQARLLRLEQFYAFRSPTNAVGVKTEEWTLSSKSEGSITTVSLVLFTMNETNVNEFVASFSNRVSILSGLKAVKIDDLAAKATWWTPHLHSSPDSFHLSSSAGNRSGALDAYIVSTPTNRLVFLNSFLVQRK